MVVCWWCHGPLRAGRIKRPDSIFEYADGTSFETFDITNFEPKFLNEVLAAMTDADRTKAETTCQGNNECIFDFAVTGRVAIS